MKINRFPPISEKKVLSLFRACFLIVVMLGMTASNSFAQVSYEVIDGLQYQLNSADKTAMVIAGTAELSNATNNGLLP